ncbi:MAG: uroporphyrinogen-III decarboxylase-like protein [Armatimonadota bacterium]|nr:MAG: uroporphyrinogen-III decarboxylase-like protein [Armatimonadota bacterium]
MPYPDLEPNPDFDRLKSVIACREPDRVPFIELFLDEEVMVAIQERPFSDDPARRCREIADLYFRLGYDYVPAGTDLTFAHDAVEAEDTAALSRGRRSWLQESGGVIQTREDFESYAWPVPGEGLLVSVERAAEARRDGMGLIPLGPGGVLENVMWLMGYGPMSYAMADEPDLVQAVFQRVGETLVQVFGSMAGHEAVDAVFLGDDMGFKTQTMISPEAMRRYVFPWQRRIVEAVHARGKPLLLHACGNLEAVMDDLIDRVGIDAKHSFEDVITPVTEAKRRWGDRVALLGGIDVDLLSRGTPEQVRRRTREVLEVCMPGGGYALGSGNSVANYVSVENYLAMLEEGWRSGVYA